MDFAFSEEQDEFREMLLRFIEEKAQTSDVRRMAESEEGFDRALWKQMAEELGLQGVAIPEAYGGQGFSFLELGIALEEMGRVLLPSPFYASACLAASAILAAGSEDQKAELLPGIAGGTCIASLAVAEPGAGWDVGALAAEARQDGLTVAVLAIEDREAGPIGRLSIEVTGVPAGPGLDAVDDLACLVLDIGRDDELDRLSGPASGE